jgi:predicted DNA-binding transcriptional regulator YafY
MRADRLLSILMSLQVRGLVTAQALARQLEVSTRTIYRDVEALSRSGVPIYAERGRSGGLALIEGYRTELTGLSGDEAQSLPFASIGIAAAALGLTTSAEAARLKVLAALSKSGRERARRADECFHLDPADWYRRPATPPYLKEIASAVWSRHIVEIDYEGWQSRRTRAVEPLGLVLKAATWYLAARHRKAVCIYRLASVLGVRVLPQVFARPRNFSLARAWSDEVARFEASLRKARADIRVASSAMSRVERLGADAAESILAAEPDADGWRRASIWIESVSHAAGLLLGFGSEIEVLSPPALREELAARAARVAALYAAAATSGRRTGG